MADALLIALLSGAVVLAVSSFRFSRLSRRIAVLEESERRFRALTELSADWFWETDAEHRLLWLSGGTPVATFFGHAPTFGKRFWEIPRVEIDKSALDAHLQRLSSQLPFFDLEIARTDERGARQVHIVSGQSRLGPDGRFLGYRGVGRDVTEQRAAEARLLQAKERLELALDGGNLAEWHFDAARGEVYAGDGWVRFLGHSTSPEATRGIDLLEAIHPEDRAGYRAALVAALKGSSGPFSCEFRIRGADGEWKWLQARGRVVERDAAGRAKRLSGTVADVSGQKHAEAVAAEREQRFRDVAQSSAEYVWETDAERRYTFLSERAEGVLGHPRAELLGRRAEEFMPLGEAREVAAWLAQHDPQGTGFRGLVHRSLTRAGAVVWISVSGVPVRDASGCIVGYRGTGADVTATKRAEARIEYLATRDPLTGLPNTLLLQDRAAQAILAAARTRGRLAVLCFDLDRFKLVNSSLDHGTGDALLRAVAERLEGLAREATLARLGGDDFVLLKDIRSEDEAAQVARRLLDSLARPFEIDRATLAVNASIGIAVYPSDGRDFAELLKNADAALHHAKESGRGTFRFFSPALNARAVERLRVENELRGALSRGELRLHWQPVFALRDGSLAGAEALVRWQHPERGLLMPDDFVPLAEECGLIRPLGEWTLERALSQAGAWERRHPGLWYAVNVSAAELASGASFLEKLENALGANGLKGESIELEVTERVLMGNLQEHLETLRRIGDLGVRLAIDDFGTGYSSLAYLRRLPIHKLKVDRSFLAAIDSHPADEAIVRAISAMAKTLGLTVAAEGVETEAQLERLLGLGCDQWQGRHGSGALDAPAFEKLLTSGLAYSGPGTSATSRSGSGTPG
ncbi:MAG: EAL domain-containing protein [Betaproteobacteria bacterium]|nr:EAL domain-containing protein [Betaproteobacteria bacterium]